MEKIRLEVGRPWVAPKLKKVAVEQVTATHQHQKDVRGFDFNNNHNSYS